MERTKSELQSILKDCYANRETVLQAAEEAIRCGMFDNVVRVFPKRWGITFGEIRDELVGRGWEGIARAMKGWEPGKSSFVSYMFLIVKSIQVRYMRDIQKDKRKVHSDGLLYLDHHYDDDENLMLSNVFTSDKNTEEEVLEKVLLENRIAKMKPRNRVIAKMRLQGYTEREVSEVVGVSQPHVNRILRKMNREWQEA